MPEEFDKKETGDECQPGAGIGDARARHQSLEGVHGSVAVPHHQAGFWRQWRAFAGPAILVSVGYMDPRNWGTDLAGGAQFKYGLLWVVAAASFMAVILQVIAARLFYGKQSVTVAGGQVVMFNDDSDWIRIAYLTVAPLLGKMAASTLFAVALLASGQSSTITGTLAGQVVMEGFMSWRIRPWIRRMISRLLAVVPAIWIISIRGNDSVTDLVNLSQVILCLILPFAMFPLLHFTSSRKVMGQWGNGWFLLVLGWGSVILITLMDIYSLPDSLKDAWRIIAGR